MTIHDAVEIWQFRDLFAESGTFALALDVSNSMDDILDDVQDGVDEGLTVLRKGIASPNELVLAAFGDEVAPKLHTTDLDAFLKAVKALESRESGDCPEVSFEATLEALRMSEPGGVLFTITDGEVKDPERAALISALALEKNIRIFAFLVWPEGICKTLSDVPYRQIAEQSGGIVVRMTRDEVEHQLETLLPSLGVPGGLNNLTVIESPAPKGLGNPPTVQVDSTMTRVSIVVSTQNEVSLRRPDGSAVADGDPNVQKNVRQDYVSFELTTPEPGTWSIDSAVQPAFYATSDSSLTFVGLDFVGLKGRDGHQGYFAVDGLPVAGKPSDVTVDLTTPIAAAVLELRAPTGELLVSAALMPQLDPDGNAVNDGHYSAQVIAPTQPFIAFVTGTTQANQPFVRSALRQVQPQYLALTAPPHQFVQPGASADFIFTVQNTGAADQFVVNVEDTEGMLTTPAQQTLTLAQGESTSVTVSLKVPPDTKLGTESSIRVLFSSILQPQLHVRGIRARGRPQPRRRR